MDNLETVGRYETVRLLGRGGMGEVYLARDPLIDRLVAVKLLSDAFDAAARGRFTREARAAGRLHHENIATIFDVGEHRGRPFIAMEYVPGETLATLIGREPPLAMAEMLRLIEDACVGLAFAHNAGIVHLDVKPENLIRCADGRLKVLDFGVARVVEGDETHTLHVVGTLRYMSPEQLTGGPIDRRSDVFALGCVLYEVIARKPAFGGTMDIMSRMTGTGVVPLRELVPDVHPDLVRIAGRAMAPDRADRYDNLETLRRELAIVRREIEASGEHTTVITPSGGTSRRPRALPLAWVVSGALVAAFGTGIWLLPEQANQPAPRPAPVGEPISIPNGPAPGPSRRAEPAASTTFETAVGRSRAAPPTSPPRSTATSALEAVPPPPPQRPTGAAAHEPPSQPPPEPLAEVRGKDANAHLTEVAPTSPVDTPRDARLVSQPLSQSPTPEDAVRGVLRAYEAAHDRRDVAALRKIFPNLSSEQAEAMGRTFAGAISYRVELNVLDLRVTGSTASATCDVTHAFVPKIGNASSNTLQVRFQLQQAGGTWLIERIEGATKR